MNQNQMMTLLKSVQDGSLSVEDALIALRKAPYTDIEFAKIDHHRQLRQGVAEIIYGAGKTKEQILAIAHEMHISGVRTILITRIDPVKFSYLAESGIFDTYRYEELPQICVIGDFPKPDGCGPVLVATGGTSDMKVAEEAALTAQALGNEVVRLYDVGVSGLHRLLDHLDEIMRAKVIIAIAGMEGALASVIGGLADCPVIAVPTSVGYGAAFGGLAALLSMLNSCASGVSVVNIDNGFGAGYQASMINHVR